MRALAVLAFVLISSTSFAATSERFSRGGWYKDFQPEIERANSRGELFRIKGHCQSNCTLFLGLRNACVERSATLLFHAGHDRQRNIHVAHTQRMLSAYNAKLRGDAGISHHSGQHDHRPVRLPGMSAPVEARNSKIESAPWCRQMAWVLDQPKD
jgi:hypothetical protein